jgi:HTH-type transcriptional regulator / antitoxin HipB
MLLGFRKNAGLTQEEVAQRLGISQQSYAAFEANPAAASVDRLFRVLRLLAVDLHLAPGARQAEPVRRVAAIKTAAKVTAKKVAVKKTAVKKAAPSKQAVVKKAPKKAAKPATVRKTAARSLKREDW